MNEAEAKILMSAFLSNIGSASAVLRRTAATNLVVLATRCRYYSGNKSNISASSAGFTAALTLQLPAYEGKVTLEGQCGFELFIDYN